MRLLVDNLIEDVRSLTDERNAEGLDDVRDILPALNRAQDRAASILARQYESPMLTYIDVVTTGTVAEYTIPEDCLEERIEKIELKVQGYYYAIDRVSFRDLTQLEYPVPLALPRHYCVIANKYRLVPAPAGIYSLRLWYLKDPPPLKKSSGQITVINTSNLTAQYLVVNSIGADLSATTTEEGNYISVIDGQTGAPKGFFQIQSITGNRINIRSTPTKPAIQGKTLGTTLVGLSIEVDDFVVVAPASCIPFLKKPVSNYIVQFAVAEIVKKLGGPADMEMNVLKMLEADVTSSWVGREQSLKVTAKSTRWGRNNRNYIRIPTSI